MKTKKIIAFIAAAMLAGTQTGAFYTNAAQVSEADTVYETAVSEKSSSGTTTPVPYYAGAESAREKIKVWAQEAAKEEGISAEEAEKELKENYKMITGSRVILNNYDLTENEFLTNPLVLEECNFIAEVLDYEASDVFSIFLELAEPVISSDLTVFEIKAGELYKSLEDNGYDCSELWLIDVPEGKRQEETITEENADIILSFTDATVRPGGTTYIDAIIDTKLDMSALLMSYKFDEDVFSLESVSLNEELKSTDEMYEALTLSTDCRTLMYLSETGDNVAVNGKYLVRFALKVDENAAEGEYDITPYQKSSSGAACRYSKEADRQEMMSVFFRSGKITVSSSEAPLTNLKRQPLSRKYIMNGSVMVGDTNSDNVINAVDIVCETQYLLGLNDTIKGGDTNEDGSINVADIIVLKNELLN